MAIQLTVMAIEFGFAGRPTTQIYYKDKLTLGREASNDIVLNRPEVSSHHAEITVKHDGNGSEPILCIVDLGSSNGTMVESKMLEPQEAVPVRPNQRIIIGNFLIKSAYVDINLPKGDEEEEKSEWTEDQQEESAVEAAAEPEPVIEEELDKPREEGQHVMEMVEEQQESREEDTKSDWFVQSEWNNEEVRSPFAVESAPVEAELTAEEESVASPYYPPETAVADVVEIPAGGHEVEIVVTPDGMQELNIDLEATELFSISGVVKHNNAPLAEVDVYYELNKATTGPDGTFVFPNITEGREYHLRAEKQGYIFECDQPSGKVSGNVTVCFVPRQLFTVRGQVTHKGQPLSGVRVDGGDLGCVMTGADGAFSMGNVAEGMDYSLVASKDDFVFDCAAPNGVVKSGDAVVSFSARQLVTISGRIMHKGEPLAGVEVDGGPLGKTVTGPDGYYRFDKVPEGTQCKIVARKDGFALGRK